MILLVGSQAGHFHCPNFWNNPKDIDLILSYQDFQVFIKRYDIPASPISKNKFVGQWKGKIVEFEIAWPDSSAHELLKIVSGSTETLYGVEFFVPTLDWLFTIKTSHRFKKNSPHFKKTLSDYFFMKNKRCEIADKRWLKAREKETYIKARPKLKTSKKVFFADSELKYIYDHDSIHEAVAMLDMPAYLWYKGDSEEVFCSKQKWKACSQQVKLYGVLEECYVLALERSQIPYKNKITPYNSFLIALMKVCTSITSGWFRAYAYENYFNILKLYSDDYLEKFKAGLDSGIIIAI